MVYSLEGNDLSKILAPDFPFSLRRFPFFYGWVILVVSTMGLVMSAPGQTIGVSVFTDFLIDSLNLSRMQLSTAYMVGTIASSFMLPWGGRLFDRVGARLMAVVSSLGLAAILVYLSQCDRIADLLSFGANSTIHVFAGFIVIVIGFTFLRYSGQGLLCLTARSMLGKWFNHKRGLASGLSGVVVTFTFSIAPLAFDRLVQLYTWRAAWLLLALISFGMAFVGWLFYRDNPEECGLVMDGVQPDESNNSDQKEVYDDIKEYTVEEARQTYSFWIFNLGLASLSLIITAVTFHIVSIGEQIGLEREQVLAIFLPMSIISIICNFIFGWICDYLELKYTLMVMVLSLAIGLVATLYLDHWLGFSMVVFGFGTGAGIFGPLMIVVWPKFYGREHLGAISSLNLSTLVFASAIGPFIYGLSYEWYGDYKLGIYICLILPLAIFFLCFKADNPQKGVT